MANFYLPHRIEQYHEAIKPLELAGARSGGSESGRNGVAQLSAALLARAVMRPIT